MSISRRHFLTTAAAASAATALNLRGASAPFADGLPEASAEELARTAARPVFVRRDLFKGPLIIDSIELLKRDRQYFVRIRTKNGAEGVSLDNGRTAVLHPILHQLVVPYFLGKDARDVEEHLFGVYRQRDNYKFQGLALWNEVALIEFALLDLLGRVAGKSIAELLGGGNVRERVPFYVASGRRDTTPEQEVEYLQSLISETGAKAVKYRVGGRMSRNVDALPSRTEKLIPLSRRALGDKIAIHADANSSYDPEHAIRVGRLLEEINAVYFEEPCPFDDFDATKQVTDALTIPVALGEQEYSEWRFQYTIRHRVADIVQPDLFYYGGLIRSIRVARMAALRNMPCIAHLSDGFGFVYMLHFANCVQNIGPWQEYKRGLETFCQWFDPPLRIVDGALTVPTGPGVGIVDPKEALKGAEVMKV